jgi:hypothetical protein
MLKHLIKNSFEIEITCDKWFEIYWKEEVKIEYSKQNVAK